MPLTCHSTQHFRASPERVYAALTELDSAEKWMPLGQRVWVEGQLG